MGYRISVDTGGTFTDVVCGAPDGTVTVSKAPTTPERIFEGVDEALRYAAEEIGIAYRDLLAQTDVLTYGTTRATNAVITGGTARTALLTTRGFRDVLVFREGGKLEPFNLRQEYPAPYVPRRLTFELDERTMADGSNSEIFVRLPSLGSAYTASLPQGSSSPSLGSMFSTRFASAGSHTSTRT